MFPWVLAEVGGSDERSDELPTQQSDCPRDC